MLPRDADARCACRDDMRACALYWCRDAWCALLMSLLLRCLLIRRYAFTLRYFLFIFHFLSPYAIITFAIITPLISSPYAYDYRRSSFSLSLFIAAFHYFRRRWCWYHYWYFDDYWWYWYWLLIRWLPPQAGWRLLAGSRPAEAIGQYLDTAGHCITHFFMTATQMAGQGHRASHVTLGLAGQNFQLLH